MKTNLFNLISLMLLSAFLFSCSEEENTRQIEYSISPNGDFQTGGKITVREIENGIKIIINFEGGVNGEFHPAHLHFGKWDQEGVMAAMLNPVNGTTGVSETEVKVLSNDATLDFDSFLTFDGSIKVHPDDGDNRKVIMAYSNIGANAEAN
ncbi:hypothetical protein [Marinigracilibium pacificum]|uniref:CHRD domain-containing protein n=1 Tax=Marinigracilibium pacificum TaxID=2729599 RepID=A0A848IY68_9BACT|nr:hypothetical protein [Marinigracilibium pacificum]NMM46929.1 hypothetical protein [Marinigracilibium pacificum]